VRNEAGEPVSDRGAMYDTLSCDLSVLSEEDRARFMNLVRRFGTNRNFLLSLMPQASSPAAERDHTIYGRRSNAPMAAANWNTYGTKLEMEGW
jgi:hypothetical protein